MIHLDHIVRFYICRDRYFLDSEQDVAEVFVRQVSENSAVI